MGKKLTYDKTEEQLVSIILPVYNAERYLRECMESITKQSYKNVEIVVIDDASRDRSTSIVQDCMQADSRIILIEHKVNKGVSKTRNDALMHVHGEYVVFVDADDRVDADFIKELVSAIGENDICICGYSKFGGGRTKQFLLCENELNKYEDYLFHILCSNYIGGYLFNKLFKREILENIRFNEDLTIGEDLVFVICYLEKCKGIMYIPKSLYQYRINESSAMHNSLGNQKMNWSKLTGIQAAEQVQFLLKERNGYIKDCCSYRVAKTSLWVLLQMIIYRENDVKILLNIKRKIKENYAGYRRTDYGNALQHIAIFIARINPAMVWRVGVLANNVFPDLFTLK